MITYVISNQSEYEVNEDVEIEDESTEFPAIAGNKNFSFDVTFLESSGGALTGTPSIAVTSHPEFVNVESVTSNTIRIIKDANTSLFDESFTFISYDPEGNSNTSIIDINQMSDFVKTDDQELISWDVPFDETANTNAQANGTFMFTATNSESESETLVIKQRYRWSFEEGKEIFDSIIEGQD